ncbi:unnamed protein product [Rhizoctonia solani]|uniref:Protein kinase domain-containing protein n=1 Tax=Rhizoctonia solani TaxID=456999 RepID=A0A8H3DT84_9AGAM|nr:unnamed protein product [Rhizoctonia solani]
MNYQPNYKRTPPIPGSSAMRPSASGPRKYQSTEPPSSPPEIIDSRRPLPGKQEPSATYALHSIEDALDRIVDETMINQSCPDIIDVLVKHGCQNYSNMLERYDHLPVAYGGFGNVHQGYLGNGNKVAIKTARLDPTQSDRAGKYQKRLAREIYTWSKCSHRNVLTLLGVAENNGQLATISLWIEGGSLSRHIQQSPTTNRCTLILGITAGLYYLHKAGIVHGDLKGANILVSRDEVPLLCDFGSSLIENPTIAFAPTNSGVSFTERWAAPEVWKEGAPPTRASDIYSLGMTILETITGKIPYDTVKNVISALLKGKLPRRPSEIPVDSVYGNILWSLLRSCWSTNPNNRPTARHVKYILLPMSPDTLRSSKAHSPHEDSDYEQGDGVDYSNEVNEQDEREGRTAQDEASGQSDSDEDIENINARLGSEKVPERQYSRPAPITYPNPPIPLASRPVYSTQGGGSTFVGHQTGERPLVQSRTLGDQYHQGPPPNPGHPRGQPNYFDGWQPDQGERPGLNYNNLPPHEAGRIPNERRVTMRLTSTGDFVEEYHSPQTQMPSIREDRGAEVETGTRFGERGPPVYGGPRR